MQPFVASLKAPVPFSVFNLVNATFFFHPRVHVSLFLSLPVGSEQTGQHSGQFAFRVHHTFTIKHLTPEQCLRQACAELWGTGSFMTLRGALPSPASQP